MFLFFWVSLGKILCFFCLFVCVVLQKWHKILLFKSQGHIPFFPKNSLAFCLFVCATKLQTFLEKTKAVLSSTVPLELTDQISALPSSSWITCRPSVDKESDKRQKKNKFCKFVIDSRSTLLKITGEIFLCSLFSPDSKETSYMEMSIERPSQATRYKIQANLFVKFSSYQATSYKLQFFGPTGFPAWHFQPGETSVEALKLMCAKNKQVYDVISLKIHFL